MGFNRAEFEVEYPFSSHYMDCGGHKYHYLDEGEGEPIVMIHGNPTWSFYYRDLVKGLKQNYRVIVPDHIGCGLSDKPSKDDYGYYLANRVQDLDQLISSLKLDNITLVLHDWGGMIGCAWALGHLAKVKRIIITNTSGFMLPDSKKLPWQLWVLKNLPLFAEPAVRGFNLFSLVASFTGSKKGLPAKLRKGLRAPYDSWNNRVATLRFVQDIPTTKEDPSYSLVDTVDKNLNKLASLPMLICWGEQDFVFDHHFLAEWQKRFPHAEVNTYAHAGHYVLEDAGQEILLKIRQFLEKHPIL